MQGQAADRELLPAQEDEERTLESLCIVQGERSNGMAETAS
jgi:hypothetical protein